MIYCREAYHLSRRNSYFHIVAQTGSLAVARSAAFDADFRDKAAAFGAAPLRSDWLDAHLLPLQQHHPMVYIPHPVAEEECSGDFEFGYTATGSSQAAFSVPSRIFHNRPYQSEPKTAN